MNKSISKEIKKIIYSAGALAVVGGLLSMPSGNLLFLSGLLVCFVSEIFHYRKKENQLSTVEKIFKFAYSIGAILVIIGAILTIFHIPGGKLAINIGFIPIVIHTSWYSVEIWK